MTLFIKSIVHHELNHFVLTFLQHYIYSYPISCTSVMKIHFAGFWFFKKNFRKKEKDSLWWGKRYIKWVKNLISYLLGIFLFTSSTTFYSHKNFMQCKGGIIYTTLWELGHIEAECLRWPSYSEIIIIRTHTWPKV